MRFAPVLLAIGMLLVPSCAPVQEDNAIPEEVIALEDLLVQAEVNDVGELLELAEQGHAAAQNNLAVMYAFGTGVAQDYVRAYMWFNLAVAQGWASAESGRDELENAMTSQQIAEAQEMATRCFESNYSDCD